jgi:hypothetical protein
LIAGPFRWFIIGSYQKRLAEEPRAKNYAPTVHIFRQDLAPVN